MTLKINGLTKKYKDVTVVNNITLTIKQGEIFGLIGKNGAGKSTTIGMLTGFITPTSGDFDILGYNYKNLDRVKRKIGVLPDTSNYYNDISAIEYLIFVKSLLKSTETREELLQILKKVGLEGHDKKKVRKYSFGMKKKLGIAQSIIGNPEIIFLDEPTSGLDPESAIEIQELIMTINKEYKTTIILTSHNLYEVEKLCTRIAMMKAGVITHEGTVKELSLQVFKGLILEIKTGVINSEKRDLLRELLDSKVISLEFLDQSMLIKVEDESYIPNIVKLIVNENIEIFRIEEKHSLENIFLTQ